MTAQHVLSSCRQNQLKTTVCSETIRATRRIWRVRLAEGLNCENTTALHCKRGLWIAQRGLGDPAGRVAVKRLVGTHRVAATFWIAVPPARPSRLDTWLWRARGFDLAATWPFNVGWFALWFRSTETELVRPLCIARRHKTWGERANTDGAAVAKKSLIAANEIL